MYTIIFIMKIVQSLFIQRIDYYNEISALYFFNSDVVILKLMKILMIPFIILLLCKWSIEENDDWLMTDDNDCVKIDNVMTIIYFSIYSLLYYRKPIWKWWYSNEMWKCNVGTIMLFRIV